VPYHRPVVLQKFDGDDIEPAGRVVEFRVFGQIAEGHPPDLAPFYPGDGFLGESEAGIGPGFDLDENQGRAVPGDDVDLAPLKTISALEKAESCLGQIADGRLLAAAA